jgi:hypothetical protein
VERFQQTLKKWLTAQPEQPHTVAELQTLCDTFVASTTAVGRTAPRTAAPRWPPTRPDPTPARPPPPAQSRRMRVRRDVVDADRKLTLRNTCRLHHIGIGRTPRPNPILMLINGLQIPIIHATTGEVIRELILNPTVDYQSRGVRKPRTKPS